MLCDIPVQIRCFPLRHWVLDKINNTCPSFPHRDHINLHIFATSLLLVTAQDVFLLLSVLFIQRLCAPRTCEPAVPLAPHAFPFSQLSFCLFASPTSLSISFILTFKISRSVLKCHEHCLCHLPGFGMLRIPGHWQREARRPCSGDEPVLPLQGPQPHCSLPGLLSSHYTSPIAWNHCKHSIDSGKSLLLPHCMISSPAGFLLITGPLVFRRGCRGRQARMCLGLQTGRLSPQNS